MKAHQYKKHFSVYEARTYIPHLRMEFDRIRQLKEKLDQAGFDLYRGKYRPGFNPDTRDEFPPEYRDLLSIVRDISDEGVVIKNLDEGLVDFPALRDNGDEVFLCWKSDEDNLEFWHGLEDGFAGRQHVDNF